MRGKKSIKVTPEVEGIVEAGVNLMCLMVTANYGFDKYLDMAASVREVISPEMPLMANIDDFTYEQALKLKDAGFDAIYHVIHMGEGEITNIDPKTRIQTIENAKKAGLRSTASRDGVSK